MALPSWWNLAIGSKVLLLSLLLNGVCAQPIVNVNYGNLNFLNANKFHKIGTNGETAGNKTLYTNVITGNGINVDCIVTTVSITNGYFLLPTFPCTGTIPFDYKEPQNCPTPPNIVTLTSNEDRYFTPTMFFNPGGGNVRFRFEFIIGGSYDNATNSGQPVILRNVMINSYDIDGNTNCATSPDPNVNQYNDFNGFNAAARATPGTSINPTYNSPTGMTRFMSTSNCNITSVTDPRTRIRVEYNFLQELEVVMGQTQGANGARAFFFLDFGPGPVWTPQYLGAPVLDLNTATDSYNNSGSFCTVPVKLFSGTNNISGSGNAINEFFISFASNEIFNGNSEYLTTDMNNSGHHVLLGAPFTGNQTFTLSGIGFRADRSESGGIRTIRYTKSNGTNMTVAETQVLLSALTYFNSVNTPGVRRFKLWFREGTVTSTASYFELYGGCMVLKARALDFNAVKSGPEVVLTWRTDDLQDIVGYTVERSYDGQAWEQIRNYPVTASEGGYNGRHTDRPIAKGVCQYRLVERYRDGRFGLSPVRSVQIGDGTAGQKPYPNPVTEGAINVTLEKEGEVTLTDLSMRRVVHRFLRAGTHRMEVGSLPRGIYILRADGRTHRIIIH